MPLYEYKCGECNETFEISKGMNEPVMDLVCPKCGSQQIKRVWAKVRVMRGESGLMDEVGTSGASCNTCVDGVCSTCSVRR